MRKLLIFWILIFSLQVFAQHDFGVINGIVTDPNSAVFPGANVKAIPIIGNKLIEENSLVMVSDADGRFSFRRVPVGLYEVEVTFSQIEIVIRKRIKVEKETSSSAPVDLNSVLYVIEGCSYVGEGRDLTTDADKAEIIREMLKGAGTYDKSKPVLSTKNIKTNWLSIENKEQFELMSQTEIQYRAETKGDFEYYSFPVLKAKGACVEISLSYFFAQGKKSAKEKLYLSGEGTTYEFRKVDGKWIKKLVSSWVS